MGSGAGMRAHSQAGRVSLSMWGCLPSLEALGLDVPGHLAPPASALGCASPRHGAGGERDTEAAQYSMTLASTGLGPSLSPGGAHVASSQEDS